MPALAAGAEPLLLPPADWPRPLSSPVPGLPAARPRSGPAVFVRRPLAAGETRDWRRWRGCCDVAVAENNNAPSQDGTLAYTALCYFYFLLFYLLFCFISASLKGTARHKISAATRRETGSCLRLINRPTNQLFVSQQLKTPAHTLLLPTAGWRRTVNCSFKLCHWRDLRRPHQVFECSPRSCGLKDTRCARPAGVAATSRPAGVAAGRVFPGWLRFLHRFPLRRRRRQRRRKPLPPLDQGVATRVTSLSGC